ncbi:hypothetical protein BDZ45DRAFT_682478 [Acephala macrosclerotiorum]|nr:hypothetical protein BDZ45DRAFT_682478 [Acephala macrosclerotiorum]
MPASSHYLRPSAYSSRLAQVPAVSTSTSNNLTPAAFNISSTQQPPVVLSTSTDLFATSLTRVASKTHWTPPNIYNTPAKFRNRRTLDGGWLWISSWDARSIFRLTIDQFLRLPLADVPGIKKTQQVYWLYHVWDLVQFETSEANADEILTNMFANQINEQTQDVWGKKLLSKKDVSRRDTTLVDAGYGAGAHPALIPGEVDVDMG